MCISSLVVCLCNVSVLLDVCHYCDCKIDDHCDGGV